VLPRCGGTLFCCLDAVIVGAPVDDLLLDGFGFEALGEGFVDERREFIVGGEAEGDELLRGEFLDVAELGDGEDGREAEAFFEADDAVLHFEGTAAGNACHDEEGDGHDDPPEMCVLVAGPVVNGDVDAEDEVEQEHGQEKEVKGRIEARVVLEVLRSGHLQSFR